MKSELINTTKKIDHSISQLLISQSDDTVILSTGDQCNSYFTGIVIHGEIYGIGHFSNEWAKNNFTLFTGEIRLKN